ncbi:hypothetical protein KFK09_013145 [Dendrobium nobile]|uniref:Uncharacterized protein n=1 Tax=Dendrobium nobile TaxID=94219 RepID=A0A8T3B6M0_DENNO|nr:hypothetical protein KFK09_013145 [Dendrobium nobile]
MVIWTFIYFVAIKFEASMQLVKYFCHVLCSTAEYYFNNGFYDQICCLGLFFGNISICKPLSCLFLRFWLQPKFYWYEACRNIHSAYFYLSRSIFSASINMVSSVQSLWTLSAAFPVLLQNLLNFYSL